MALLDHFIKKADSIGLPVKMLRYVQRRYSEGTTKGRGFVHPSMNHLRLNKDNAAALGSAAIGGALTGGVVTWNNEEYAVDELYHEATHAYIDLKIDEGSGAPFKSPTGGESGRAARRVAAVMSEAEAHYNVTMVKGRRDPIVGEGREIANEAAAMYIGRRASMYWRTVDWLTFNRDWLKNLTSNRDWLNRKIRDKDTERLDQQSKFIFTAQTQYNMVMANLVQGYYTTGMAFAIWSNQKQREVEGKRIPRALKAMCDDILEHKIPDHFSAAPLLAKLAIENWNLIGTLREMK